MATRSLQLTLSPDRALGVIRSILEKKGWTVRECRLRDGFIAARTSASFLSWGEDVTVRVSASSVGSLVEIVSQPVAQLFDWGRSQANVNALALELEGSEVTQ